MHLFYYFFVFNSFSPWESKKYALGEGEHKCFKVNEQMHVWVSEFKCFVSENYFSTISSILKLKVSRCFMSFNLSSFVFSSFLFFALLSYAKKNNNIIFVSALVVVVFIFTCPACCQHAYTCWCILCCLSLSALVFVFKNLRANKKKTRISQHQ